METIDDKILIKEIERYEKRFSCYHYNGRGAKNFVIKEGRIPVMISAPHAVNHSRNGELKKADKYTGAIAELLHRRLGCHIIYTTRFGNCDPNYDSNINKENLYQTAIEQYIAAHDIKVLIDIHGASASRNYAVEMGTAPFKNEDGVEYSTPSLHGYDFIVDLIRYSFDYALKDVMQPKDKRRVALNEIFSAGKQNTITKYISQNTPVACVQLEINAIYRNCENPGHFSQLLKGLMLIVYLLGEIDWGNNKIEVYRMWQSTKHKPQDVVELDCREGKDNLSLRICAHNDSCDVVLRPIGDRNKELLQNYINNCDYAVDTSEYVVLTNRLIETIYGREWIVENEGKPMLCDAPVILCGSEIERYEIGTPKANQLENIYFSTMLYDAKKSIASNYSFIVYNRFTDTHFHIDFDKADYRDFGRVRSNDVPAKKIMIPLYYKQLLGYQDCPFKMIREELYHNIVGNLLCTEVRSFLDRVYQLDNETYRLNKELLYGESLYNLVIKIDNTLETEGFLSQLSRNEYILLKDKIHDRFKGVFAACYKKLPEDAFYYLNEDADLEQSKKWVGELEKILGFYKYIELIKKPRNKKVSSGLGRILSLGTKIRDCFLDKLIGKSEYLLKTEWCSKTDDKNNVARLSQDMMSLLGVSENDKVVINFGDNRQVVRVLVKKSLTNYQIAIPAHIRKRLKMNSVNDIVSVHRDMAHTFMRTSQAQIIAILGTILAVFQISNNTIVDIILSVISIPLIWYWILNEERIKVK